jgi:hypothetical protein
MAKTFWDTRLTMHLTFTQKTNEILKELAMEKGVPYKQILEQIINESETFKKKEQELEQEGRFKPFRF